VDEPSQCLRFSRTVVCTFLIVNKCEGCQVTIILSVTDSDFSVIQLLRTLKNHFISDCMKTFSSELPLIKSFSHLLDLVDCVECRFLIQTMKR
jgi:hypothetical protein